MVVSVMKGHACRAVCDAFGLPEVQRLRQQGQGRIHATFRLAFAQRNPIILQAVNTDVFPHIDNIADNIARISAYLRRHGRQPHVLEPVALHNGLNSGCLNPLRAAFGAALSSSATLIRYRPSTMLT